VDGLEIEIVGVSRSINFKKSVAKVFPSYFSKANSNQAIPLPKSAKEHKTFVCPVITRIPLFAKISQSGYSPTFSDPSQHFYGPGHNLFVLFP